MKSCKVNIFRLWQLMRYYIVINKLSYIHVFIFTSSVSQQTLYRAVVITSSTLIYVNTSEQSIVQDNPLFLSSSLKTRIFNLSFGPGVYCIIIVNTHFRSLFSLSFYAHCFSPTSVILPNYPNMVGYPYEN